MLIYKNKPVSISKDIVRARLVYESELCPRSPEYPAGRCESADGHAALPHKAKVKEIVEDAATRGYSHVAFDIECWHIQVRTMPAGFVPGPCLRGPATADEIKGAVEKYVTVLRWAGEFKHDMKIGYYATTPPHLGAYWAVLRGGVELEQWKQAAAGTAPIAREADFVSPSLYTFFDKQDDWVASSRRIVAITKELYPGKPVIPFIWPQYHESSMPPSLRYTPIPGDFWRRQLETLSLYADGAFIWGGANTEWNESAAWWQQTKAFLGSPAGKR
jgi:hypothetical protein